MANKIVKIAMQNCQITLLKNSASNIAIKLNDTCEQNVWLP